MAKRRKTDDEIRKTRNARMLRYYYSKKEKALAASQAENQKLLEPLRKELASLFFRADMDDIDVNKIESVKEVKLNKNYNIQVFKLGNNYLWRYKCLISNLLPRDQVLKDAKRTLF